jgi:hypothetical protein
VLVIVEFVLGTAWLWRLRLNAAASAATSPPSASGS